MTYNSSLAPHGALEPLVMVLVAALHHQLALRLDEQNELNGNTEQAFV